MRQNTIGKTLCFFALTLCLMLFSALSLHAAKSITANVMAPLHIDLTNQSDVAAFQSQMTSVKNIGANAVSVDVWWGLVEGQADQKFDWSYYDSVFQMIVNSGLKVQPIMSFHQCGGNVGDTYDMPIPNWIWQIAGPGGKYISEQYDPGNPEIVSVWAQNNQDVLEQYYQFMDAFEQHFAKYAGNIQAINVSCGPAGELRYPSYNSYSANGKTWGRGYPTRGYLQCYSAQAVSSFQNAMAKKYGNISSLNNAWGTSLSSFSSVNPPGDGDDFFQITNPKAYINGQYGKDFIEWYNSELVRHGQEMLSQAISAFDKQFVGIELEIKIPGVHWEMSDPNMPRSAEVCAGLLANNFYIFGRQNNPPGGSEYLPILNMVRQLENSTGRNMLVYFTCLEMSNGDLNNSPYSQASALVFWVGSNAGNIGLTIKGENALSPNGGSTWDQGGFWWNINNALAYSSYTGITILRIGDVSSGQQYYNFQRLINNYSTK
ncbi:MAG: family 14 glycosylhydrolase [Candidatus Methanoperedens sp.]